MIQFAAVRMTQDDDLEDDVASEMASASTKITFRQHEATSPQLEPAVDHAAFPSQTILPTELWERIMLLVGVEEMHLMTLVSKQHHMISQTASFRARHFLRRHKRSVAIHKASNYSQLFTAELFEVSLRHRISKRASIIVLTLQPSSHRLCSQVVPSCLDIMFNGSGMTFWGEQRRMAMSQRGCKESNWRQTWPS